METKLSYKDLYPQNKNGTLATSLDREHSPFKILAHSELLRKYVAGEKVAPLHIRIGLTNSCNIRCKFCNFHSENEVEFYNAFDFKDSIETDAVIEFLKEFYNQGGRAVTFCGSGECTIHPGYRQICYEAHRYGLKIGIITNGTMLGTKEIRNCIADTHTWIRIGMNAGKAETFEKITSCQKKSVFTDMFSSVKYLRTHASEPDFKAGLNYVITMDNYQEIVDATRLAKESFANYIRFEPEFYTALAHATIYPKLMEINELLMQAKCFEDETFEVSIPKLDRGPMDRTEKIEGDFKNCHYRNFVLALGADGCLYPCPQIHLNDKYCMGNVIKEGYENWINSGKKEEWFENNSDRRELCKTCFYRPQNELLECIVNGKLNLDEVLSEYEENHRDTLHADFV